MFNVYFTLPPPHYIPQLRVFPIFYSPITYKKGHSAHKTLAIQAQQGSFPPPFPIFSKSKRAEKSKNQNFHTPPLLHSTTNSECRVKPSAIEPNAYKKRGCSSCIYNIG